MTVRAISFDFWMTLFEEVGNAKDRRQIRVDAFREATGRTTWISAHSADETRTGSGTTETGHRY